MRVGIAEVCEFIASFSDRSVEHILVKSFASLDTFGVAELVQGEVDLSLKPYLLMIIMVVDVILLRRCIGDAEILAVLQGHRDVSFLPVFEDVRGRKRERLGFM